MEHTEIKKYSAKVKKLPGSRVEIAATIPSGEWGAARSEAIKHIGANMELSGFRKGHVPETILAAKIGEEAVLEEMAEIAIGKAYPSILGSEKLDVLGRPEVRITKIARGNPLEFTITTAIFPEITLPDYKKLAAKEARAKKDSVVVSDDEVGKAIQQIRRKGQKTDPGASESAGKENAKKPPLLDDAYVKTLGGFTDVEDFKTKLRENLAHEKERGEKDKRRVAIIDTILAKTATELPEIIITQELLRMEDEFAQDALRMGLTMDAYLKMVKKTKEDVQKEWRPDAQKRATTQLVVSKIAELEKLEPDTETLKNEVVALRARYPNATEERAEGFVRMLLTNEKVFQFLESQEA